VEVLSTPQKYWWVVHHPEKKIGRLGGTCLGSLACTKPL
jgi:hypothetical protein